MTSSISVIWFKRYAEENEVMDCGNVLVLSMTVNYSSGNEDDWVT